MTPQAFPVDTAKNSSFSRIQPGLQLAVDSTSLGEFKTCPRRYYYRIIRGLQPLTISHHLTFGLLYHGALERYDHRRSALASHDDALDFAVEWVLKETWDSTLQRPAGWGDSNKNRMTLLRTIVDYLDKFGEADPMTTVQLANGKPAVELSFSFFSGLKSELTGEPFTFCGHLDRLASLNGIPYVQDRKTTSHTISPGWFAQFSPHNQFSLYSLAAQVVWSVPVRGVILDGAQVAVGFSRFERALIGRDQSQLEEWHRDAGYQLRAMELCAKEEYWPMNDQSCDKYGGCPFRSICSKPPASREQWLQSEFRVQVWDPLERRGDI